MVTKEKIQEFWNEFSSLSQEIIKEPENEEIIQKLNQSVDELGNYDWEYGPSDKAEYYFCLSPNLQEELLEDIEKIVSIAPLIQGWEIMVGKPRKKEPLTKWIMLNEKGEEIVVDTGGWQCVIYKFPDSTYDLDVKIQGVNGDEDTQYTALDIHLTNILGEKEYLELVKERTIVPELSPDVANRSVFVKDLYRYLAKPVE